ncbi:hypothetical protein OIO90_003570 [Microbotryomycetes sp. JL221]|nr:hypothetical protein OIO90_003570 [Microbotryomycetes sp. JL221]
MVAAPPCIVHGTPELDCLDFSGKTVYNDFRDDLVRDGFCVVKNVLPKEKAAYYVQEIHQWLEDFGLGYDRNDPSTIREECLPVIHQKGLIQAYGAPHESFTWSVRSEPDVIDVFAKIFGTEDLLTSFDAVNVSLPRKDLAPNKPWAHQDQDPDRPGFRCVQGFVNLLPNGPQDGGLVVLKQGHIASKEYHKVMNDKDEVFRWTNEMYVFQEKGMEWLKEHGYEWVKVDCEAGDLVLWDSRTPHYNVSPSAGNPRMVVYTCYAPVSTASEEDLLRKKQAFEELHGHSHWPQGVTASKRDIALTAKLTKFSCSGLQPFIKEFVGPKRNGEPDPLNTWKPRKPPVLSERAFKLTGIPYIKSSA